jgi:deoxyribodipyrimidine photolyase-related protein
MSHSINLVFPHQLFADSTLVKNGFDTYLIEEFLYFRQYKFHKQKITFHRAAMKSYESYLTSQGVTVHYIESGSALSDVRNFGEELKRCAIKELHFIDPTDNWLRKRVLALSNECEITMHTDLNFMNTPDDLKSFFKPTKKSFFQTSFYKQQRKKFGVLLDEEFQPVGGKWTYDADNRKKYPKNKVPPAIHFPKKSSFWDAAIIYTEKHFSDYPGTISMDYRYPINHAEGAAWLEQFLTYRFHEFGPYEDAIVQEHSILNHSLLSPLMNSGLLLPEYVVNRALEFSVAENVPINSTEGFVRQVIGWREFIRGMYAVKGTESRTMNFWKFDRKIPQSFYDGTTGIVPVDNAIKKALDTGYCNHIERLMILGNFMLLCEFDPDEVFRWFMELFIDAYDWVMVPNVYGMCLFADGGFFATKPYISGANYIKKMSNFKGGEWEAIWNGLFWNFIDKHQDFFSSNPRMSMMVHSLRRMSPDKKVMHLTSAEQFLGALDG